MSAAALHHIFVFTSVFIGFRRLLRQKLVTCVPRRKRTRRIMSSVEHLYRCTQVGLHVILGVCLFIVCSTINVNGLLPMSNNGRLQLAAAQMVAEGSCCVVAAAAREENTRTLHPLPSHADPTPHADWLQLTSFCLPSASFLLTPQQPSSSPLHPLRLVGSTGKMLPSPRPHISAQLKEFNHKTSQVECGPELSGWTPIDGVVP